MAFKNTPPSPSIPDTPDKLLRELPRRKIPDVMPHQREIMRTYVMKAEHDCDVALQLPTGSGKTLVGLLIAEWRRRKFNERVVYLCPTNQLVNQVAEQAEEKYGLSVQAFTGQIRMYSADAKTRYQQADRVAVTSYSSLFNTNPYFENANTLILDDVHASEGYIASNWSIQINRMDAAHQALHAAICVLLKAELDTASFTRLSGGAVGSSDNAWVDKLPTPSFAKIQSDLLHILDAHLKEPLELRYPWQLIRDHLHACQLYYSAHHVLIRPIIPPTWTHTPFSDPTQRIYMSATLGEGGDLERIVGRPQITKLPTPEGWDRQGVGRRFFIFPGMSLNEDQTNTLRTSLMNIAKRSLVLVPSSQAVDEVSTYVQANLGLTIFYATDLEQSKSSFAATEKAVAIVANRYDGIDFPGDECRLLFVEGLPKAMNLQERFLMARMGATVLYNERVQVRVLQAIGRCTRSLEDYSAVIIIGDELTDYLADQRRRKYFQPELQAEIDFGVEQSKETSLADMTDNFAIFLDNGKKWESVNQQIVAKRGSASQEAFPAMKSLFESVTEELQCQSKLWQGDYEGAMASAESVLAKLTATELRGYRAWWHYIAGSMAWLGAKADIPGLEAKSKLHYEHAKSAAKGIPWLVSLARSYSKPTPQEIQNASLMEQIERLEILMENLGLTHDMRYTKRETDILSGLLAADSFEQAHMHLGELLGYEAGKEESEGAPDPWWIAGEYCFVFEDHAGAKETSSLSTEKARQAASHENWMRTKILKNRPNTNVIQVLITPVKKATEGALPHLGNVALWKLDEFRVWAKNALAVVRKLRSTFCEAGDLEWRERAAKTFIENRLDTPGLSGYLKTQQAREILYKGTI